jgi:glycosyltransferase involved in cell wall biosynthesis
MPMPPFLTIIVATYNVEASLRRCLTSIQAQRGRCIEVLISDGGSSDGTLDIVQEFRTIVTHVRSSPDAGIYDAWNRVLDRATGEWLLFLGADDELMTPTVVEQVRDVLADHTVSGGFASFPCWITGRRERMLFKSAPAARVAQRSGRMGVAHTATLHHRSLFAEHGSFDATFTVAGDLEFLLRCRDAPLFAHPSPVLTLMGGDGLSNARRLVRTRHSEVMRARSMHGLPAATPGQRLAMMRELAGVWRDDLVERARMVRERFALQE